jgi:hypothetical protein
MAGPARRRLLRNARAAAASAKRRCAAGSRSNTAAGAVTISALPVIAGYGASSFSYSAWPQTKKRSARATSARRVQNNSFHRRAASNPARAWSLQSTSTPDSSSRVSASRTGPRPASGAAAPRASCAACNALQARLNAGNAIQQSALNASCGFPERVGTAPVRRIRVS